MRAADNNPIADADAQEFYRNRSASGSPHRAPQGVAPIDAEPAPLDVLKSLLELQQSTLNVLTAMISAKCPPSSLDLPAIVDAAPYQPGHAASSAQPSASPAAPFSSPTATPCVGAAGIAKQLPDDVVKALDKHCQSFQKLVRSRLRCVEKYGIQNSIH
jgi:hypothetical protein